MTNKKEQGMELKKKNRNRIYRFIYDHTYVTKQDILVNLQLSLPTITQNLIDLMQSGFICQKGSVGNTGGRRARGYCIVEKAKAAVGIDINRTHFSIVALDLKGNFISKEKFNIPFENSETYFRSFGSIYKDFVKNLDLIEENLIGAGICVQGIISSDGSEVLYGKISNITGLKLKDLDKYIPHKSRLFHDADAAAFAELWAERKWKNAVYISLSTNLGSSVIINSDIYIGEEGYGGKIEHMTLKQHGKECYCGKKGCAECYCSVSSLLEQSKEISLDHFFGQLKAGKKEVVSTWETYKKDLSIILNNLRMIFDCDIILGGYMGEYLEDYMEEISREVYKRNGFPWSKAYITLCKCRVEPVAFGAALKLIDDYIISI